MDGLSLVSVGDVARLKMRRGIVRAVGEWRFRVSVRSESRGGAGQHAYLLRAPFRST